MVCTVGSTGPISAEGEADVAAKAAWQVVGQCVPTHLGFSPLHSASPVVRSNPVARPVEVLIEGRVGNVEGLLLV